MSRRIVILSVDSNPTYAWFVPLCTLMWRDVAGFDVSCIYVSGGKPLNSWLLDRAVAVGTMVYNCYPPVCCSFQAASQLVRLFSYLLPGINHDDYLVSVDADAWPLAPAFAPTGAAVDLIYPEVADRDTTPYFPIGYIGATANRWSDFMGISAAAPEHALQILYDTDPTLVGGHSGWNYDETLVTRKIKAFQQRGHEIHTRKRSGDPPVDRIDRAAWPAQPEAEGHIDAHLVRPGWTDENWPKLRPLLVQCLTSEHMMWADNYRESWHRSQR